MGDIEINHSHDEHTADRSDISSPDELGSLNGNQYECKYSDVTEIETNFTSNSSGKPEPNPHEPKIENIAVANSSRINVGDRAITRVSGNVIYNRYHIQQINNSDSNDQSK